MRTGALPSIACGRRSSSSTFLDEGVGDRAAALDRRGPHRPLVEALFDFLKITKKKATKKLKQAPNEFG